MRKRIAAWWHRAMVRIPLGMVAVLAVLANPYVVAAATNQPNQSTQYLPSDWQQPMDLAGNGVVAAIVAVARFVIPIIGAFVFVIGLVGLVTAVGDAWRGKEVRTGGIIRTNMPPVLAKTLEVFLGIILIGIPLSGMWVPLINAVLSFGQSIINAVATAIGG